MSITTGETTMVFFAQGHDGGLLQGLRWDPARTEVWRNMHENLDLNQPDK
jgi:hypothetical protein